MQELHKRIGCHISVFLGAVAQLPRCLVVSLFPGKPQAFNNLERALSFASVGNLLLFLL